MEDLDTIVTVNGVECFPRFGVYDNGRIAMQLIEKETGEVYTKATVNLPYDKLGPGEMFIKAYSENEGVLEALIAAKLVIPTGRAVNTGYVTVPVVRLIPTLAAVAHVN